MPDTDNPDQLLRDIKDPYRRLVESVSDYAIFLLDPQGKVMTWNPGAERIKGYSAREIIGQSFLTFYTEEAKARRWPQQELSEAALKGRVEDEGWRVRKNGDLFWANVVITALKDDHGKLRGFCKITRDLSERRKQEETLRQSEERFRLLVDSVKDYAIFMLDVHGRVASWNPGAERIKGYKRSEIIGQHLSVFYTEEGRARKWPEEELRTARESGRFEDEGQRVRKDGSTFWANVVLSPVYGPDGKLHGYAKVTRDLTDQRRVEALEKAQKQTNEFLAMLAHELRNPLAPIRNALHLLSKKPTSDPSELWVREVLQRQTIQMTRLVDDLLDVSRITRSAVVLNKAPIDLGRVVRDAAAASLQWMQERQHVLEVVLPDEKLELSADPVRLNQILQNLLHNAAKFTPNGGKIRLSANRAGERIVATVEDNGVGMTPELRRAAFGLFTQGEQGIARVEGGLGVGLTLVERLVALHGGTIEARSEGPGRGSEFVISLPAGDPATLQPEIQPAEEHTSRGTPQRILVVDDNLDAAHALRYLLESDGHVVRVAADGATGIALAKAFKPDVLLLDIGLPKMDGYELAKRVREDSSLRRAKIIGVTGYAQARDRERAAAAGFDHHLTKPVDFPALQLLIRSAS
jgi:PAS domain S-box-containing protein